MARAGQRHVATTWLVLITSAISIAACGDDDAVSEADTGDVATFCAIAPDPTDTVPASYVGSAEHVEDLRDVRTAAPTKIRDDLELIIRHFDEAVDPSDGDSQLTENFPAAVNAAIGRVTTHIDDTCAE